MAAFETDSLRKSRGRRSGSSDPEKERLQREKELAELRASIAENQAELLSSRLPIEDLKASEGEITVDDSVAMESKIQAYNALRGAATAIADSIVALDPGPKRVVLLAGDAILLGLRSFRIFEVEARSLEATWQSLKDEAKRPPPEDEERRRIERAAEQLLAAGLGPSAISATAAGLGLKALIGLLSLARVDTRIKGVEISIGSDTLLILVARSLMSRGTRRGVTPSSSGDEMDVRTPELFPDTVAGAEDVVSALEGIRARRGEALVAIALLPEGDKRTSLEARAKELATVHDDFEERLASAEASSGRSLMTSVVEGASLAGLLKGADSVAVLLRVRESGGSVRTKRALAGFWNEVEHSGGVIVTHASFRGDGTVVAMDATADYRGHERGVSVERDHQRS